MVALNNDPRPEDQTPPPPEVIAWCKNLVRILKDGAVWGIPRSGTTFRIDKENKRLVLVVPGEDGDDDFYATRYNFGFIGWSVVTPEELENAKENAE